MSEAPPVRAPVLECIGLRRRFGAIAALDGVDLTLRPGEVHALLGENGAGKSTLMRVVTGATSLDAGSMKLEGRAYCPESPAQARRHGVEMVYQELSLAPHLTVEENISLGREPRRWGWVDRRARRARARDAMALIGAAAIEPGRRVKDLGPGERQLVEIARALVAKPRILVLDEPTTSLSRPEVTALARAVEAARAAGTAIVLVTHYLDEARGMASVATVLRDGRVTLAAAPLATATDAMLMEAMVGREIETRRRASAVRAEAPARLEVRELRGERLPRRASLEVRAGEIVGIAGLIGSGRTEFLRCLAGLDRLRAGSIVIDGAKAPGNEGVRRRQWRGVILVSEDRRGEGLALNMSMMVNASLGDLGRVSSAGFVSPRRQRGALLRHAPAVALRAERPWRAVRELSGGNQQKVALLRILHQESEIVLLDEPTRGIDVAAKAQVHRVIEGLADAGKAVVMVSSYLPELLVISDRIAVMNGGVLGAARAVDEWSEASLVSAMMPGATS